MKFKLSKELKNFYIFMTGQFVSQFGSKLTSYGLVLWSYQQSGSVLSMSLLSVCYLIPEITLSFLSGGISDHWNKKKIMLTADTIAAVFSFGTLVMLLTGNLQVKYLYIINFMLGITDSFQNPACEVAISAMVSRDNYMKTSGFRTLCDSFTGILAPVIAASIYALFGLRIIVFLDLSTFLFAFFTLAFLVKIPHIIKTEKGQSLMEQCIYGVKYIIKYKGILNLILFMAFVNFIAAIYNTNLTPMVLLRNGYNYNQLGVTTSMTGIAGLIGSLFVSRFPEPKKRIPLVMNIITFSFLLCNGLLGIGRNYYVWCFALLVGNIVIPFFTANVSYIMRTKVPYEQQGKVFSARNTLQYMTIPIGNLAGGFLSDKVFVPFMNKPSAFRNVLSILVGSGKGSGIGLLFVCIALLGAGGCCLFRKNKNLLALDDEII